MSSRFAPKTYLSRAQLEERSRYAAVIARSAPPAPRRPELGAKVQVKMAFAAGELGLQTGRIVYINEPHLWYTVELPNGIRESFKWGCTE